MKKCFLIPLFFIFILNGCSNYTPEKPDTISILSSDLSLDKDPDDWFDTYLFLTMEGINPAGIILENYATDTIAEKLEELIRILEVEQIAIKKGIQEPLQRENSKISATQYHEGAEYILESMRKAQGKVRLIAVGTLRNEAYAYTRDPDLFKEKVDKIYFAGGTLNGEKDVNVKKGKIAADIIIGADIPIIWIPCTHDRKQKLSGPEEKLIAGCSSNLCEFFTNSLADWRKYRGEEWLRKTGQTEGKNLWSIPAFLHITEKEQFDLTFIPGTMTFDEESWTRFEASEQGEDLMLQTLDQEKITEWLTRRIVQHQQ